MNGGMQTGWLRWLKLQQKTKMKSIKDIENLEGKKVLVRVDFNVPLENGEVINDRKLRASLPTIDYLLKKGTKVILASHLGRPGGKIKESLRLAPVAKKLQDLLESKVHYLSEFAGNSVQKKISEIDNSEVVLLENVRFSPDERENSGKLAHKLANLADIFVMDGFGITHRDHSSVSGVAQLLPAYSGLLLQKELNNLDKVLENPNKPLTIALGGVKVATKLPVIKNLLDQADYILVGGGIANTYLKAKKFSIGNSIYNDKYLQQALDYCDKEKVVTPDDVVVGDNDGDKYQNKVIKNTHTDLCSENEMILDIGPKTAEKFSNLIKKSKTVVWNGAMGYFEQEPYDQGTRSITEAIANLSETSDSFTLAGGGETVHFLEKENLEARLNFVSTGGGAMLYYLAGKKLPGIVNLKK